MMKNTHLIDDFLQHTGLIQIDVDNIPNLPAFREKIKDDPYTYAGFISPSGNGYKIIVRINVDKDAHIKSFGALQSYYKKIHNVEIDKQCCNVNRLMFISSDRTLIVNEKAKEFIIEPLNSILSACTDNAPNLISINKEGVVNVVRQINLNQTDITNDYGEC